MAERNASTAPPRAAVSEQAGGTAEEILGARVRSDAGGEERDLETLAQQVRVSARLAYNHSVLLDPEYDGDPDYTGEQWAPGTPNYRRLMRQAGQLRWLVGPQQAAMAGIHRISGGKIFSPARVLIGPRWVNRLLGWRWHPEFERVREGVTTSDALDGVNNARTAYRGATDRRLREFVWHMSQPDAIAVTQRLWQVFWFHRREIRRWVPACRAAGEKMRIVCLASGSTQAAIDAIYAEAQEDPTILLHIELHLVDVNETALAEAVSLAEHRGIRQVIQDEHVHTMRISDFCKRFAHLRFHVVEEVGFLDYRPNEAAVREMKRFHAMLAPGGRAMVAFIGPSPLQEAVRWVTNWPRLIRRPLTECQEMVHQAGWRDDQVVVHHTVMDIHMLFELCSDQDDDNGDGDGGELAEAA